MTKHHFSFREVFGFGWTKTKQHIWFIVLTFIIISTIISAIDHTPILNVIVPMMVGLSLVSISILISRDHHFTFADLFNPVLSQKRVLKFLALTALYLVPIFATFVAIAIVVFGAMSIDAAVTLFGIVLSLLLIVPSIYITVRFKFFPFVVIEHENASFDELVRMTFKLTNNHFWPVFWFLVLASILNFIGFILFFVGLLVTIPVTLFATAHMYNKLKANLI